MLKRSLSKRSSIYLWWSIHINGRVASLPVTREKNKKRTKLGINHSNTTRDRQTVQTTIHSALNIWWQTRRASFPHFRSFIDRKITFFLWWWWLKNELTISIHMYSWCVVLWCSVLCCRNWLDLQPDRHPAAVLLSAQVGCLLFVQLELPPQLGRGRRRVLLSQHMRCHPRRGWGVWRRSEVVEDSSGCVQKFINEMQVPGWALGTWDEAAAMLQCTSTSNCTLIKKMF